MQKQKIFISNVQKEFAIEREALYKHFVTDATAIRLAPELSLENLKRQHASYPTNPLLAECMYQAGYIERFGTGTLEIFRLSAEAHLEEPAFNIDEAFKVILWRPSAKTDYVTDQVTDQVDELIKRLVSVVLKPKSQPEIMAALDLRHTPNFRDNYLRPAMEGGYIEMENPESPNSPKQRYRLTESGIALKKRTSKRKKQ